MKLPGWIELARKKSKDEGGEEKGPVLLRLESMDARFRRICAVYSDGRCVIAEGYAFDAELRTLLQKLRREGSIPRDLIEEKGTLEDLGAVWEDAAQVVVGGEDRAIAGKLMRLVEAAAHARASDIVFEIEPGACRISVIANDRRKPLGERLTEEEGKKLTGFLFHSKEEGTAQTSYRRSEFQGFSVRPGGLVKLPRQVTGLRCERGPNEPDGDHLIARIFYRDQLKPGTKLESLGFSSEDAEMFAELRGSLSGGIILGGSTGDGKSTTLAVNLALQQEEHGGELNVITVEDPVEYDIPGTIQIAVPTTGAGEERGTHFSRALMHFVRVHPAVGMVSEVRDAEAAREVLQFIATGHQVWTTIHVGDANGILFRVLDMGVDPAEVCRPDLIKLLMKQTLLPLLCPSCSLEEPVESLPEWLVGAVEGIQSARYRNPKGCEACAREGEIASAVWSGFERATAVCESIRPDAGYLRFVRQRDAAAAREYWVKELRGVPIGLRLWGFVAAGRCDPRDALRKGAKREQVEEVVGAAIGRDVA